MNKKTVRDIDVKGKKVLVRCDFNVPLDENKLFSTQEIGKTTINSPTELKDNAMSKVQRQQQELIQTQENQETLE